MSKKKKYTQGDWFAVPLRDSGFATGLVARINPGRKIAFGYFFGPRRTQIPEAKDVSGYNSDSAIFAGKFGDLNLINGQWPVIAHSDDWTPTDWPMPALRRIDVQTGKVTIVRYSEDDLTKEISSESTEFTKENHLPEDGVWGAGAVELRLTKLLS